MSKSLAKGAPIGKPIPIILCDHVSADQWFDMVKWMRYIATLDPTLHESNAYKASRGYIQSRWESAFEVLEND